MWPTAPDHTLGPSHSAIQPTVPEQSSVYYFLSLMGSRLKQNPVLALVPLKPQTFNALLLPTPGSHAHARFLLPALLVADHLIFKLDRCHAVRVAFIVIHNGRIKNSRISR